tara:strand:+ start:1246 stop:1407 length:162 start_codon:yes stop_codon:yes gene_type:complete
MTDSITHLLDTFDHLIETLQEADVDADVITMVEGAKEALIEEHAAMFTDDSED